MSPPRSRPLTACIFPRVGWSLSLSLSLAMGLVLAHPSSTPARAQAPGPESFAKTPETPQEYWDAIDYLLRTGQGAQAVPYIEAFLKNNPSDDVLVKIRDSYGVGSFLRLDDDPATRPYTERLITLMTAASQRQARDPARLEKFASGLLGTTAEQQYALEELRKAGADAVPALVQKLQQPGLDTTDKASIVDGMSRLRRSAVPPLVATLDSPNANLAADAAQALGRIGDPRALPFLAYPAATPDDTVLRQPARRAIERITGRSYPGQTRSPVATLLGEARRYLTHQGKLEGDLVRLWSWQGTGPVANEIPPGEAEGQLGVRFARQALELDPENREGQALLVALAIQKEAEKAGIDSFLSNQSTGAVGSNPSEPLSNALGAGPRTLGDTLNLALDNDLDDLAAATTHLLGRVTDRNSFISETPGGPVHPLIRALSSGDSRTQFAAAQSLATLGLRSPFPGCSDVVPILSRFVQSGGASPRAVVVDTSPNRGNAVAATLQGLGYETLSATDGREGFREAISGADVQLVLVEPSGLSVHGPWNARDLIANFRADSRTANLPVLVYGPLGFDDKLGGLVLDSERTSYVVTPTDPQAFGPVLERELKRLGARPISPEAATAYAQQAAAALTIIGGEPGNPFEQNLSLAAEPLSRALSGTPQLAALAALALGNVPTAEAQRDLANRVIDPSVDPAIQGPATAALVRSLQRFGPLLENNQEKALLSSFDQAADPARRQALSQVIGALKPAPAIVGPRLRDAGPGGLLPPPAATTPPAAPAPAPAVNNP